MASTGVHDLFRDMYRHSDNLNNSLPDDLQGTPPVSLAPSGSGYHLDSSTFPRQRPKIEIPNYPSSGYGNNQFGSAENMGQYANGHDHGNFIPQQPDHNSYPMNNQVRSIPISHSTPANYQAVQSIPISHGPPNAHSIPISYNTPILQPAVQAIPVNHQNTPSSRSISISHGVPVSHQVAMHQQPPSYTDLAQEAVQVQSSDPSVPTLSYQAQSSQASQQTPVPSYPYSPSSNLDPEPQYPYKPMSPNATNEAMSPYQPPLAQSATMSPLEHAKPSPTFAPPGNYPNIPSVSSSVSELSDISSVPSLPESRPPPMPVGGWSNLEIPDDILPTQTVEGTEPSQRAESTVPIFMQPNQMQEGNIRGPKASDQPFVSASPTPSAQVPPSQKVVAYPFANEMAYNQVPQSQPSVVQPEIITPDVQPMNEPFPKYGQDTQPQIESQRSDIRQPSPLITEPDLSYGSNSPSLSDPTSQQGQFQSTPDPALLTAGMAHDYLPVAGSPVLSEPAPELAPIPVIVSEPAESVEQPVPIPKSPIPEPPPLPPVLSPRPSPKPSPRPSPARSPGPANVSQAPSLPGTSNFGSSNQTSSASKARTKLDEQLSTMSLDKPFSYTSNASPAPYSPNSAPYSNSPYSPSSAPGAPDYNSYNPVVQSPVSPGGPPSPAMRPTPAIPDAVLNMAAKGPPEKKPWTYAPDMNQIREQREKVRRSSKKDTDITQSATYRMIHGLDSGDKPRGYGLAGPAGPQRPIREPSADDELRFSGLRKDDIPSRSFQRLQEMTDQGGSEIDTSSIYANLGGESDDVGHYDEQSIRYKGRSIPSKSFRMLQNLTGTAGDDMPVVPPAGRRPRPRALQTRPTPPPNAQQDPDSAVDVRYVGGSMPSKSFRMLQQSIGEPESAPPVSFAGDGGAQGRSVKVIQLRSQANPANPASIPYPSSGPITHEDGVTDF